MLFIILKQSISSIHSFQTKFNKRSFQLCLQNIFVVLWISKKGLHFQVNLMLCQIKEDTCNVLHSSRPKLQWMKESLLWKFWLPWENMRRQSNISSSKRKLALFFSMGKKACGVKSKLKLWGGSNQHWPKVQLTFTKYLMQICHPKDFFSWPQAKLNDSNVAFVPRDVSCLWPK